MGTIAIEGMTFYANHGYFKEEASQLTRFSVDIYVSSDVEKAGREDSLSDTVNYQELYDITRDLMSKRVKLLEKLAVSIANEIRQRYPDSDAIRVRVSKWHPPVGGEVERSFVEYMLD